MTDHIPNAAQSSQVPEGWKLVPLIPTTAMLEAGTDNNPTQWTDGTDPGFAIDVANDVYVSMVRVAQPPAAPVEADADLPTAQDVRGILGPPVQRCSAGNGEVPQDFTAMLRARADCIRATNFVHIGEQDARDFAELFDKAAAIIDSFEEKTRHEEEMYMDGLD
ncbi:hypothetical protein ACWAT4_21760 [Bradyrhizobium manausense]